MVYQRSKMAGNSVAIFVVVIAVLAVGLFIGISFSKQQNLAKQKTTEQIAKQEQEKKQDKQKSDTKEDKSTKKKQADQDKKQAKDKNKKPKQIAGSTATPTEASAAQQEQAIANTGPSSTMPSSVAATGPTDNIALALVVMFVAAYLGREYYRSQKLFIQTAKEG